MRRLIPLCAVVALAAPLVAAQARSQTAQADPDRLQKGGGGLPPGWTARLDSGSTAITGVNVTLMGAAFHFITGPAGIYYKPDSQGTGVYTVQATFTQAELSEHPEAYGLFIGGSNLDGPRQQYTYFLLRQDGRFLVKRRIGASTPTITDWTAHAAVKAGKAANLLAIDVGRDKVRFLVNGKEVSAADRARVDAEGIAGLRINHNLNVMVENFGVK